MKYILMLLLILAVGSSAQSIYPYNGDKSITTAVDTATLTTKTMIKYELFVSNLHASDTLQWRTDWDTAYSNLYPLQSIHLVNTYAKKIFRKAKTGGPITSQLRAN